MQGFPRQFSIIISLFLVSMILYSQVFLHQGRQKSSRKTAILIGDSITQQGFNGDGWVSKLCHEYSRKVDFFNRGYSGYNSEWVWSQLNEILGSIGRIDLAVVFLGANDAVYEGFPSHVDLETYSRHLTSIVLQLQTIHQVQEVILVSPPPIAEGALTERNKVSSNPRGLDRDNGHTKRYVDACRRVAHSLSVGYVDTWAGLSGSGPESTRGSFLRDGLHLNEAGNDKVFELIRAAMVERGWKSDAMDLDLPPWQELTSIKAGHDLDAE